MAESCRGSSAALLEHLRLLLGVMGGPGLISWPQQQMLGWCESAKARWSWRNSLLPSLLHIWADVNQQRTTGAGGAPFLPSAPSGICRTLKFGSYHRPNAKNENKNIQRCLTRRKVFIRGCCTFREGSGMFRLRDTAEPRYSGNEERSQMKSVPAAAWTSQSSSRSFSVPHHGMKGLGMERLWILSCWERLELIFLFKPVQSITLKTDFKKWVFM